MLKMPNWVIIGATARNAGKTNLAVWLIEQLCKEAPVCAVKVVQVHGRGEACPRGGDGCGICAGLQEAFDVREETLSGDKDTMRFLAAGARKVLLVRTEPASMEQALAAAADALPAECVVVCESTSAAAAAKAGYFFMFQTGTEPLAWKASARRVLPLADRVSMAREEDRDLILHEIQQRLPLLRKAPPEPTGVTVTQAQEILLPRCAPLAVESVSLAEAWGRILASNVTAQEPVPPFSRSPLDGYALRAADICDAGPENPVCLRVIEEVPAGSCASHSVGTGEAIKILTGAPIPAGADVVVKFEDTAFTDQTVTLFAPLKSGSNLVPVGEDLEKGAQVLEAGTRITPPEAGLLAALGYETIPVHRCAQVTLLSTGNELLPVDAPLEKGKIRNSSIYTLCGYVRRVGASAVMGEIVPDDANAIADAITAAAEQSDVVLTTGGVSVGDYDMVHCALEQMGAEILFWKVRMKPGMACIAAMWHGKLIIGLSGNPAAATASLFLLVLPCLRKMMGNKEVLPEKIQVVLGTDFPKSSPGGRFVPGQLCVDNGVAYLMEAAPAGNGMLRPFCGADLLGEFPAGSGAMHRGETVTAYRIFQRNE